MGYGENDVCPKNLVGSVSVSSVHGHGGVGEGVGRPGGASPPSAKPARLSRRADSRMKAHYSPVYTRWAVTNSARDGLVHARWHLSGDCL